MIIYIYCFQHDVDSILFIPPQANSLEQLLL